MNRVICVNGHFYDGDKYEACPHCAEGVPAITPEHFAVVHGTPKVEEKKEDKKEKKGLFGKKKETKTEKSQISVEDDQKTERLSPEEAAGRIEMPMSQKSVRPMESPAEKPVEESIERPVAQPVAAKPVQASQPVSAKPMSQPVVAPVTPAKNSLQSALFQAADARKSPSDEGKTVGFFSTSTEPPVGYLICTKGDDFGRGFLLKSGNNTIGRSQFMDVVIMDPKVSREKQAFVMYEPRKREFYVKPGEGSGLCYYNDELVLGPTKIKQFDKIAIGDTELMLIQVCGENFSWDELV